MTLSDVNDSCRMDDNNKWLMFLLTPYKQTDRKTHELSNIHTHTPISGYLFNDHGNNDGYKERLLEIQDGGKKRQ